MTKYVTNSVVVKRRLDDHSILIVTVQVFASDGFKPGQPVSPSSPTSGASDAD